MPGSSYNANHNAVLSDNIRHFRNIEFGAYFCQDDWKVTKRLTLNLEFATISSSATTKKRTSR